MIRESTKENIKGYLSTRCHFPKKEVSDVRIFHRSLRVFQNISIFYHGGHCLVMLRVLVNRSISENYPEMS